MNRTNTNIAIAVAAMLGTTANVEHPHVPIGRPCESLHDAIREGSTKLKNELRALAEDGRDYENIAVPDPRVLSICLYLLAEQQWENLPPNARKLLAIVSFVLMEIADEQSSPLEQLIEKLAALRA